MTSKEHKVIGTISIQAGSLSCEAEIFDTPTGRKMLTLGNWESLVHTWGDEIYAACSVGTPLEPNATEYPSVGDLALWPTMPAFCIFYGPTPMSVDEQPRAASKVNVFGRLISVDRNALRSVPQGSSITFRTSVP